ncbi:filamentous hemagglutinin N-terminal domain-containing protein [Nostocales cyanobacterium LEGE 12452]|nr:filamentous hemagglutinin N-terminal domain-containing protein [Nostocales cyanobacterium LEGE 12452]
MNQADHRVKDSIKNILFLCLISIAFSQASPAKAQITPDNTLGAEASQLNQNQIINGALGDKINGGATRRSNLFHSFSEFNIKEGQRVYFANPTGIENILTRVTGGNASNIFGTLGVDGAANLFLINPSGILFGENAQLDVQGSFVGTTANGVQFGNQGIFSATNPQAPPLLTVNPSALFFNQINQGAGIQNNSIARAGTDPAGFNIYGLRVADGKSLLLVGGNVSMDGGELNAYGGRVELGGLAAPGNINLLFNGDNLSLKFPENVTRADVSLTNKAFVYVEAAGGGDIAINARNINILGGSQLNAGIAEGLGKPEATAGDITLNATGEIKVADSGSRIRNLVREDSKGNGGNITIDAGSFSLSDGAQLAASTLGQGNAGNVTVGAKNAVSLANGDILSTVEAGGVGKGGNIDINAATLSLTDSAQLLTATRAASATQPAGRGNAGNVNVLVTGAVDIAGEKNNFPSAIFTNVGTGAKGNGGNINISSGSFFLTDGARLVASTSGEGLDSPKSQAGNITLNTTGKVEVAGENSYIRSTLLTGGVGNGGNITIDSGSFFLSDGAELSASTFGQGNAGNVTVGAKNAVDLAGNAYIFSTVQAGGVGKGGNIDINAATLSLTDSAQLLTATRAASATQPAGRGDAGDVNVKVTGAVDIAGEKNGFPSGIRSNMETGTVGNGGNITIDSGSFSLQDGAQLVASTFGQGNAGNVTVRTKDAISLTGNAYILSTVEAGGVGKGGNIDINATTLSLTDGGQLLTATRGASATQPAGQGDAGNVNVLVTGAVDIVGQKNGFPSAIFSLVNTGTVGNGGNITIDSGDFSLSDGALLNASTFGQGNAGDIRINAKDAITVSGTSQETGLSSALFTFTDSTSTGKGGDINANTNIFRVSDSALVDARTRNNQKGGDITVNANVFEALNGGQLITTTSSNGRAGKITVNADEKLIISGSDSNYNGRSTNFPDNVVNIGANSGLFVSSTGSGITGDIEINSPEITLDNKGKINAESASGNGGNINANSDLLLLRRGAEISTSAGTEELGGDGGDININSKFIIAVPEENSDISANAFTGTGGNIQINSQGIFGIESRKKLTQKSDITASSELGVSGVTNINTPDNSSIQNSFTGLLPNVIDTNALIANSCISRGTKRQENSFTITGSGALRYTPGDVLTSAYTTGDVRSVELIPRPWKKGDPIIEPTGLYRLPNGQLILSRSC